MIGPLARPLAQPIANSLLAGAGGGSSDSFDYIGSDALAAYDITALKTGVTRCFRVRRSSDNSEQDCLTVAEAVTFCGAGAGYVTKWYDQNGSNDHAQTTTTQQPRIVDSGVADEGFVFDGSNDELTSTLTVGTTVTLAFWAKFVSGSTRTVFSINNGGSVLRYNGSTTMAWFPNTATTQLNITIANISATWAHVALTQTGTTYCLYIDGSLVETGTTAAMAASASGTIIGRFAGGNAMYGPLRDVRIYSVAKSALEVAAIKASVTP